MSGEADPGSVTLEGKVISGKYHLVKQIGAGGMGAVYEAKHTAVERTVAVKFLKADLADNEEALTRFDREAKAAGRIDHDNICEVFDYGVDEGSPYIVMPLLRGQPLDRVIDQEAPMPIERSCDIALQTLSALAAAHEIGLVHRDLKPENIFLTTIGDRDDFVKVLDFGISKTLSVPGQTSNASTLTSQGTILGTPYYMAPEQARAKAIDGRIDIYAMGVILYEMVTGERPIKGQDIHDILANIFFTPITPPSNLREDLPPELDALIQKAMSRDPDDRFQNAQEMRLEIASIVGRVSSPSLQVAVNRGGRPKSSSGRLSESIVTPDPAVNTMHSRDIKKQGRMRLLLGGAIFVVVIALAATVGLALMSEEGGEEPDSTSAAASVVPAPESPAVAAAGAPPESNTVESEAPAAPPPEAPPVSPEEGTIAAEETTEGAAAGEPANTGEPSEASDEPETVTITLEGLPEGASIRADGEEVEGPSFEVPRSEDSIRLVVRSDGYRSWQENISVHQPSTIQVRMQPRSRGRARPASGRPRPTKAPLSTFGAMP